MQRIVIIISLVALSLFLQACPAFVIKKIEEQQATLDSLRKSHSANYLTKSVSYNDISSLDSSGANNLDEQKYIDYFVNILNTDTTEYPNKITIDLVISDTNGRYLTNLAPPYNLNYEQIWKGLKDSCEPSSSVVRNLVVEEVQMDNSPKYAIAFLLDHSPSMGMEKIKKLQKGVIDLVQYLKEPDMVSITKFTSDLYSPINLTRNKFDVLDSFKVDGLGGVSSRGTYYFDAINAGIDQLKNAPDDYKKIVIAFTDGGDTGSEFDKEEIIKKLKESEVKLYNIGYGFADSEILAEMSDASNGKFYMTFSSNEFPYVLRDIYLKLSSYYRITYEANECPNLHKVNIPINLASMNMIIEGNTSYYIPDVQDRKVGDTVFLNIEFNVGKSVIKDKQSLSELSKIADWMKRSSNHKILIKGHTDDTGDQEYNQELSTERANAVKSELVRLGIDESRISIIGFGSSKPLVPNNSDENRQRNRRTEIEVIE
ncbi:MAG: OmpA family protein [Candidatus Kapaibacterium sp.]